jgi:glycosyltransferase involved in cell wall biosynthesis
MRIWLIHLGELLPIDGSVRLFRYGILAKMLAEQGHQVTRWAPTFVHAYKKHRFMHDQTVEVDDNYRIELLYARGYHRNISLARARFHREMAHLFIERVQEKSVPDIILSGMPTPEMCLAAIQYAKGQNVPIVVDVRDLWPDIYLTLVPSWARKLARSALWPAFQRNRRIFSQADAILGVSKGYLDWGLSFANRKYSGADAVFHLGAYSIQISQEQTMLETKNLLEAGVDPKKLICCFFGQFGKTYDLETAIGAARALEKSGEKGIQFVLCGDGAKMPTLRRQANDLKSVVFTGWVSRSTIEVLMNMSSIGLAAYAEDAPQSLPNKPFDYFAGGLPVLSSLRGELDQILISNNCGMLYKAGDPDSLVNVICYLRDNSRERLQMGQNARQLFKKQFSSEQIYSAMIDHLQQIAYGELVKGG